MSEILFTRLAKSIMIFAEGVSHSGYWYVITADNLEASHISRIMSNESARK